MKRILFALTVLLIALLVVETAEAQVRTVITNKLIARDSARVQGNLKVNGALYAKSTKAWGVKTWGTTLLNPDTLVATFDSTCAIILQPLMTNDYSTADTGTAGYPRILYAKVNGSASGGKGDTIFVYQTSPTAAAVRIKYSYFIGHPSQ